MFQATNMTNLDQGPFSPPAQPRYSDQGALLLRLDLTSWDAADLTDLMAEMYTTDCT